MLQYLFDRDKLLTGLIAGGVFLLACPESFRISCARSAN